jgi:putative ABC transport system permease protein
MNNFFQDVRVAVRQIGRQRAFSTIVIVTVALGIGATTTFFSVLNAFVFRPLPYSDPARLISVHAADPVRAHRSELRYEAFSGLSQSGALFRSAVAYASRDYNASGAGSAVRATGTEVSGDLFGLLGASFAVGRPFLPEDFRSTTPVAVIGHAFWVRHYARDPSAVGSTLVLDGRAYQIVGVAPETFAFPHDTDIWLPFALGSGSLARRRVEVVARLQDGVTVEQANAAMAGMSVDAGPANDPRHAEWRIECAALRDSMTSSKHRDVIGALLAATFVVLLIACGNLAGLLLAHLSGRRHEIAVRAALGARRSRIVALLLIESLVLAIAGGACGTLLAQWGIDVFGATLGKPHGMGWLNYRIDGRVLLFGLLASSVTALLFGLAPAIGATRVDLRSVLQEDERTVGGAPRGQRLRVALVAAQVAVSLGLIAAASSIVASSLGLVNDSPFCI